MELGKTSLQNIVNALEADNGVDTLNVKLSGFTIDFDVTALKAVLSQAKGDTITLLVEPLDQSKLNDKQKEALSAYSTVKVFEAYLECNGKRISDFNGGTAAISMPFTVENGRQAQFYHVFYLNPNGDLERLTTIYYDRELAALLPHCSEYAIVYDESQPNATASVPTFESLTVEQKYQAYELAKALDVDIETAAKLLLDAEKQGVSVDALAQQAKELMDALGMDAETAGQMVLEAAKQGVDMETLKQARALMDALGVDGKMVLDAAKQGVDTETLKQAKALMDALGVDAETAAQLLLDAQEQGISVETLKKQADEIAKALGVDAKTAAMMALEAAKLGVSLDTVKLSGSTLKKMDVDSGDAKGSAFGKLTARATKRTDKTILLQWKRYKPADGYLIYGNQCGKKYKMKLVKTIKKNKTVKLNLKKLKKGKYYKYMVVAYKNVNGQKMPIAASVTVHAATKGMKYTIAKSVKVNKTSVSLKKGKTFQLKASEVKDEKKKTIKQHRKIKYESDNKKVATVNKSGMIMAKGKGKTTVYVYAQNGLYKKIAVTVK